MKVFLIVLLVLALLLVLLCMTGPVVAVSFRGGRLDWSVRYCGIKILPRPKKDDRKKAAKPKKSSSKKKSKKKQETPETPERKDFFMDKQWKKLQDLALKSDIVERVLYSVPKPVKRLFGGISWYAIETDFLIGGEDAADCAQLYGKVHSVLHLLLGTSGNIIKVKRKKIAIACDFTADASRWDFAFRFRIQIGAVLAAGIGLAWRYFISSKKAVRELSGLKI